MVIFLHGSGPNDRDETLSGNKPFKDLAEGLTTYGISSYRFDKRTKVAPLRCMGSDFNIDNEITDDAVNILRYFHSNDTFKDYKLYIIGHSLGAMMGPKVAQIAKNELSGLVMMAGNARPLEEVVLNQFDYLGSILHDSAITKMGNKTKIQIAYLNSSKFNLTSPKDSLPFNLNASYWSSLKEYNQVKTLKKLRLPILILQGEKDYQVTMEDFDLWQKASRKMKNVSMKSYPSLNHLFMENPGIPSPEAYQVKQNIPSNVIHDIAIWINKNGVK